MYSFPGIVRMHRFQLESRAIDQTIATIQSIKYVNIGYHDENQELQSISTF